MEELSKQVRALLWEAHAEIQGAAQRFVRDAESAERASISYPPEEDADLTEDELAGLAALSLSEVQQSALRKMFADQCSSVIFRLLAVMDGVGDPQAMPFESMWYGLRMAPGTEHDEDQEMLHDAFYDEWHAWNEHKIQKAN